LRNCYILPAIVCALLSAPAALRGQIRIVSYNTETAFNANGNTNPGLQNVLQGMGNESINGIAKRVDILTLQEQNNNSGTTTAQILTMMNNLYGAGTYAKGNLISGATTSGNTDSSALIYDQTKFQLVQEVAIGTPSTSGMPRQEIRYQMRPTGYGTAADFYIYVGHWKAQGDPDDMARRNIEAQTIRGNANTSLPAGSRVMYVGDMNLTGGTSEAAWTTITAAGNGQGIDPQNGSWANGNRTFSSTNLGSRLDFLMHTPPMNDGDGFSYMSGSFHGFGNNGTTPLGSAATSGSNTALPGLPNRATVLSSLTTASDHYPVVAQYQYPAKMGVAVGSVPSQVIVGASVPVNVTVTNTAPALIAAGADGLTYSVNGSGAVTGSANASNLAALAAGNIHVLNMDTTIPGPRSGAVNASATSQEVGDGSFSQNLNTTVLAHANASFDTASNVDDLTIDFGIRALGSAAPVQNFGMLNLIDPSGFTAALDVDAVIPVGDTAVLGASIPTFSNLPAGGVVPLSASLATSAVGLYSATYIVSVSDQDLPGATTLVPLTLWLTGRVALGGDANLDNSVNSDDFNILATNFGLTGQSWLTGDFSLNGLVDSDDFNMLASNFGLSAAASGPTPQDWAALAAVVPEPASLAWLLLAAAAISPRRLRAPPIRSNISSI
jgi:endonuclease/exonuclease/phosphatase family metal-dependent hydrolase